MFPVSTKNIPMVKKKPYLYSIIFFITIDVIYQKFYTIKVISVMVNMKIILFYSYFTSQQTVKKTKSCKNKIVLFLKQFTNKGIQSIRFHFILFSISFFFFFLLGNYGGQNSQAHRYTWYRVSLDYKVRWYSPYIWSILISYKRINKIAYITN